MFLLVHPCLRGHFKSLQMLIIVTTRQLFSGTVRGCGEHGTRYPLAVARTVVPGCMHRLLSCPLLSSHFASLDHTAGVSIAGASGEGVKRDTGVRFDANTFSKTS